MPRDDAAQIELWRLPLLSHANRSLALDRFSDLTRRNDVAVKGSLKRPQCDGIAIGCTCPELQFLGAATSSPLRVTNARISRSSPLLERHRSRIAC